MTMRLVAVCALAMVVAAACGDDGDGPVTSVNPAQIDVIGGLADCASAENALEFWTTRSSDPDAAERASDYIAAVELRLVELDC